MPPGIRSHALDNLLDSLSLESGSRPGSNEQTNAGGTSDGAAAAANNVNPPTPAEPSVEVLKLQLELEKQKTANLDMQLKLQTQTAAATAATPTPDLDNEGRPVDLQKFSEIFKVFADEQNLQGSNTFWHFRQSVKAIDGAVRWVDTWRTDNMTNFSLEKLLTEFADRFDPKNWVQPPRKKQKIDCSEPREPSKAMLEAARNTETDPAASSGTRNPLRPGKYLSNKEKFDWMWVLGF